MLSLLDRYLTVWILLAMLVGVALGVFVPAVPEALSSMQSGSTNIPLAVGLILMMFPPLAKVRYEKIGEAFANKRILGVSFLLNWIIGPAVMVALAVLLLPNDPEYVQGLMLIGIAPCIAMVIVWNDLAGGNREYAAGLVALNSLFQVLFYSVYAWFLLTWLAPRLGMQAGVVTIGIADVAESVVIYLGVPLIAGFLTRRILVAQRGAEWYEEHVASKIGRLTLTALLATIVVMFSLKASSIVALPLDVLKVALPLLLFFIIMFFAGWFASNAVGADAGRRATIAFTAASNNFELAIAVSIAMYGVASPQAFAAVIGPLIEVPVMLALVRYAKR